MANNNKSAKQETAVTEGTVAAPEFKPTATEPVALRVGDSDVAGVKVFSQTDKLLERRGKAGTKDSPAAEKIETFNVLLVESPDSILSALRVHFGKNEKALLAAVNNLFKRLAYQRANKKAFGISKNIAAVIKMLEAGGMTTEDARKRALETFKGMQ